jgi:hypothetical protein
MVVAAPLQKRVAFVVLREERGTSKKFHTQDIPCECDNVCVNAHIL